MTVNQVDSSSHTTEITEQFNKLKAQFHTKMAHQDVREAVKDLQTCRVLAKYTATPQISLQEVRDMKQMVKELKLSEE